MAKSIFMLFTFLFLCLSVSLYALPSFPGAEGWGADNPGGRGGTVIHVTNLNDAGTGSLRDALVTRTGPRIVVFDIGGIIDIRSDLMIGGGNGYLTIAGQTAPGGITLSGGTFGTEYATSLTDMIVRHMRFRGVQNTTGPGEGGDNINIYDDDRVILDHVSASWGCDEVIDAIHSTYYTLQWSIIANPALFGQGGCAHAEGSHNKGTLSAYGSNYLTYHHVFHANYDDRGPLIEGDGGTPVVYADIRNLVDYNYTLAFSLDALLGPLSANVVGCYFDLGPGTTSFQYPQVGYIPGGPSIYLSDCYNSEGVGTAGKTDPFRPDAGEKWFYDNGSGATWLTAPITAPAVTTQPVLQAKDLVLAKAGAMPRDSVDRLAVRNFIAKTGTWGKVDCPLQVQGMGTPSPTDTDRDGMPDVWETANGLNPAVADDKGDKDGDGYTNIEEYINDVAQILVNEPTANPTGGVENVYNPSYSPTINKWYAASGAKQKIMNVSPNPFCSEVKLEMRNVEFGMRNYGVAIYNCGGKLVYSAFGVPHSRIQTWDGKDFAGNPVPPGIYVARLIGDNRVLATEKLVLVR